MQSGVFEGALGTYMQWFVDNGICSRKRPNKKFQLLYEWVEDEVDECGFILATEVQ